MRPLPQAADRWRGTHLHPTTGLHCFLLPRLGKEVCGGRVAGQSIRDYCPCLWLPEALRWQLWEVGYCPRRAFGLIQWSYTFIMFVQVGVPGGGILTVHTLALFAMNLQSYPTDQLKLKQHNLNPKIHPHSETGGVLVKEADYFHFLVFFVFKHLA